MDAWLAALADRNDDFSTHVPLEPYIDKTNGRRKELSLSLFHYLNHSNTPIRTKTIEEVAVEAHRRGYQIFDHWYTPFFWNTKTPSGLDGSRKLGNSAKKSC